MKLRLYPAQVLLQPTKPVTFPSAEIAEHGRKARDFAGRCHGYALAANQLGLHGSWFVFSTHPTVGRAPWLVANPKIIGTSGLFTHEETCLSLPELWPKGHDRGQLTRMPRIVRANVVAIHYQDQDGNHHEFEASGILGRVLLHELDHLLGKTYLDLLAESDRPAVATVMKSNGLPVPWPGELNSSAQIPS